MKKKIAIIGLCLIFLFTLSGCTKNYDVPLETIDMKLQESGKVSNLKKGDSKTLKRFYSLNSQDFEAFLVYSPENYMDVSEILIIRAKDPTDLELIESAIDERNANQIHSFSGYGPEQVALLENYEIKILGNTIFYCVSPDALTLKEIFVESMNQ
ncbi:MAG: DUF4358 domain-containing protein [Eubacteriaceae bacterium]